MKGPMMPTYQRLDSPSSKCSGSLGNIHFRIFKEGNENKLFSSRTALKSRVSCSSSESAVLKDGPCTCETYQYENVDTTRRSRVDEKSFGQGTGWTCPDCTFVNTSPLHLACYVCAKKKPHNSFECSITKAFDLKLPEISVLESQIKEYQNYENIAIEAANLSHIIEDQMTVFKAIEKEGRKHSNLDLKELHWILDEGAASLKRLNKLYKEDRKKYDKTVEYQAQKEIMIAAKEGCKPSSTMYAEAKPGVQHISPAILEWQGQQRMLDDWKIQLDERQSEMTSLQAYHQKTLNRILS